MNRQSALDQLAEELPVLRRRYDVRDLAIFGSVARDEARAGSDLDILVTFEGAPTLDSFVRLEGDFEEAFGVKIDLATCDALRPELRTQIESEAVDIASRLRGDPGPGEVRSMGRNWRIDLTDIRNSCRKIQRFPAGLSREQLLEAEMFVDAILRNLEIAGEAAKNVPEEIRAAMPGVLPKAIAGMRDWLAHGSFRVDDGKVWDAVSQGIPSLLAEVDAYLAIKIPGAPTPGVED